MKTLHIADMLHAQRTDHVSFHTPGHKLPGTDITELSYSDCLASPHGVILEAERDAAKILHASRTYFLTDGSTSGVYSMLWALRAAGKRRIAAPAFSHPCVVRGCEILSLQLISIPQKTAFGIPVMPTPEELEAALEGADALLLTSPDYYGFLPPLREAKELCDRMGKVLVIDGAHGSHLHFDRPRYAGTYAAMWVDGLHKSLPAMTQGAAVSAVRSWSRLLGEGALHFRTSSPSYPILMSVEAAVKSPRNIVIERLSAAFKEQNGCVKNDDWTKILVPFGSRCDAAMEVFEQDGVYPEFCDGNYLLFYLSSRTTRKDLELLGDLLRYIPRGRVQEDAAPGVIPMYAEGS